MRVLVVFALVATITACADPPSTGTITGRLLAGPTCPVETDPPDPECLPRLVAGATVIVTVEGADYEAISGEDGNFMVVVPTGPASVAFEPVEGLMGIPDSISVEVVVDASVDLGDIFYDTGIR